MLPACEMDMTAEMAARASATHVRTSSIFGDNALLLNARPAPYHLICLAEVIYVTKATRRWPSIWQGYTADSTRSPRSSLGCVVSDYRPQIDVQPVSTIDLTCDRVRP